ncbi:MAG: response regulator [Desulfovibrionaceae bacterium]
MRKILVVEDDPAIQQSMCDVLEIGGFTPEGAKDGAEALSMILQARKLGRLYDLVITDISMPVMNGLDLIRWLLEKGFQLPVLVVTGYGDKEMLLALREMGFHDCLDKPFEPEELRLKVQGIFSKLPA